MATAAALLTQVSAHAAGTDLMDVGTFNSQYKVQGILQRSAEPYYSYSYLPFRILGNGRVQGVSHLYQSQGDSRRHKKTPLSGQVTRITETAKGATAIVEGRAGNSRFKFRLETLRDDVVRGSGTIRYRGKTVRVKINNQRQGPPVKI